MNLLERMDDFRLTMEERLSAGREYRRQFTPDMKADCEVDLHCHSFFSDGYCSPTTRICEAWRRGMSAVAVVDHDNFDGCCESIRAGEIFQITVIPGVEFYTEKAGIEILGFFPDIADFERKNQSGIFQETVEAIRGAKKRQLEKMIRRIPEAFRTLGIENAAIDESDIAAFVRNGLSTKGDISVILQEKYGKILQENGICSDVKQLHAVITSNPAAISEPLEIDIDMSPEAFLQRILDWGGVPVLAHPTELRTKEHRNNRQIFNAVEELQLSGLRGIEVDGFRNKICPECGKPQTQLFEEIRCALNALHPQFPLLATNGSDSHNQPNEAGLELGCGLHHNLSPQFGVSSIVASLLEAQKSIQNR